MRRQKVGGDGSAVFLMYCMDEEKMEIKKAEKCKKRLAIGGEFV